MPYDILVVGGGPAGLTAAIYGCRSGKSVLIVEKEGFGGQIALSPRVENYPGVGSISGVELADSMLDQAIEQGAETEVGEVVSLYQGQDCWIARTDEGEEYQGKSVILAVGAEHRPLALPGEEKLVGKGISYCAVCDGDFYRGKDVCVCGGGDTALQEALLLSDICASVKLIHRRREFRGESKLLRRLEQKDNVTLLTPYNITRLVEQEGKLSALVLSQCESKEERVVECQGLFVCYGQVPATASFRELLPLEGGYVSALENGCTPLPGLFVAGDCRKKVVRQLTTAVGDGANAALSAIHYLEG